MNKITLATLLVLFSSNALAADDASWNGFYGSVLAGRDFGDVNKKNGTFDYGTTIHNISGANSSLDGWNAALKIGFNKQINDNLIGVELGASILDGNADGVAISQYDGYLQRPPNRLLSNVRVNSYESVSLRIGHIFNENTLAYLSGGIALGQIKSQLKDETGGIWIAQGTSLTDKKTESGYIVGFGLEHKLNEKLYLRANYEYLDFGSVSFDYTGHSDDSPQLLLKANQKNSVQLSTLSVGLSYKF
ncbi:COG3637 Opacity protein and related surface antigens [Methylophilaceae bacterium]|jgi:opacity protein-like surface antigen